MLMRLTAEMENLMWLYGYSIHYACPSYEHLLNIFILKSNVKLFAYDTSLYSVVKNKEERASNLTNDLDTISKWAHNWKMYFNPDPKKPTQEGLLWIIRDHS